MSCPLLSWAPAFGMIQAISHRPLNCGSVWQCTPAIEDCVNEAIDTGTKTVIWVNEDDMQREAIRAFVDAKDVCGFANWV